MTKNTKKSAAKKILLVEDCVDHARLIQFLLEKAGYDVHHVDDGVKAYDYLSHGASPDLVITDVVLPGMSGFDLLLHLKEDRKDMPIIVLTSKDKEEDVIRGFEYGALDYIRKPFVPAEVLARVGNVFKKLKKA